LDAWRLEGLTEFLSLLLAVSRDALAGSQRSPRQIAAEVEERRVRRSARASTEAALAAAMREEIGQLSNLERQRGVGPSAPAAAAAAASTTLSAAAPGAAASAPLPQPQTLMARGAMAPPRRQSALPVSCAPLLSLAGAPRALPLTVRRPVAAHVAARALAARHGRGLLVGCGHRLRDGR
jgi:hypothetical protein